MKRLFALLMALSLLCTALVGCGTEAASSKQAEGSSLAGSVAEAVDPAPQPVEEVAVSAEAEAENPNAGNEYELPLTDELTTFKGWISFSSENGMSEPNDGYGYQKLEELSNVHIDWTLAPSANTSEVFNLSVASGDYPDMYYTGGNNADYYVGGLDKYIENDVILDLSTLIPEYAPNYHYWRTRDPMVEKMTTTDGGNVPYFQTISEERQYSFQGGIIRQDLLDEYGIVAEDIKTYDDLYEAMVAIKNGANKQPLLLANTNGLATFFMVGYGVTDDFYNDNGTAVFGPIQEGFKKYLTTMHKWYEEGLVDTDFISNSDFFSMMSMLISGDYVVACDMAINLESYEQSNPEQTWAAFQAPMEHADDKRVLAYNDISPTTLGGGTVTITTACENPELLCRWIDLGYAKDMSLLYDYGIEDVSYIINAEGEPEWTELIYDNEEMGYRNMRAWYQIGTNVPHLYDWNMDYTPVTPDKVREAGKLWDANYEEAMTMPTLSMDEDDASEYASLMGDINTYLYEYAAKFIIGEYDIEAQWDEYVNLLNETGLPRATELEQAALDNFLSR